MSKRKREIDEVEAKDDDSNTSEKAKYSTYFDFIYREKIKYGVCKLCPTSESIKMSQSNTKAVRNHLEKFHPDVFYNEFCTSKTPKRKQRKLTEMVQVIESV